MTTLTTHRLTLNAKARRVTLDGRDFLVAPVVAIVEGVLNGELVTMEEVGKPLADWEGKPLVIDHPERDGVKISAFEAGVPHYGFLAAPSVNGKFKAEAWWDKQRLKEAGEVGEMIIHNLEHGHLMEGSTAYFADHEPASGKFKGVPYVSIARKIAPDHYAVLPNGIGACSIRQGCGICANSLVTHEAHSGAMVAFFLDPEDAQAMASQIGALPAGSRAVPVEEMHITLAYLGDVADLEADGHEQGQALESLMRFAGFNTLVRGRVNGLARFLQVNEDGTQALVALVDSPMLDRWRAGLVDVLEHGCDLPPAKNHAFTPHITLAYLPAEAPTPAVTPTEKDLVFQKVALAWGGQVTAFTLQGEAMDTPQTNAEEETLEPTPKQKLTVQSALSAIARAFKINLKEADMDKTQVIQQLVANERCPLAQPALEKLSLEELQPMVEAFKDAPITNQQATPDLAKLVETAVQAAVAPLTVQVQTLIANQKTAEEAEKTQLIADLVANEACPLPETALKKLDLAELQAYAAEFAPADYSARGLRTHAVSGEAVPYTEWVKSKNGGK